MIRLAVNELLVPGYSVATGQSVEQAAPVESPESEPIWADIVLESEVEEVMLAVA